MLNMEILGRLINEKLAHTFTMKYSLLVALKCANISQENLDSCWLAVAMLKTILLPPVQSQGKSLHPSLL